MKKHRLSIELGDIAELFRLRMKLIGQDMTTRVVLITSILLFALMIFSLAVSAEDQSSLPIGIVDYDKSNNSKELISNLKKVSSLKIIEKDEETLGKLLLDEMIASIFVINEGYDQSIRDGDLKKIITAYYKKDNKAASILSDIIAGEMMYSICYYKGLNLYEQISFDGKKHSGPMYEAYMQRLQQNSNEFDFAFDMNYINPEKSTMQEGEVSNSLLYHQLIFGILGILMAFIAMFILSGTVGEKEIGVTKRFQLSRFHTLTIDIGNYSALLAIEGLVSLVFTGMVFARVHSNDIKLMVSAYVLLLLNAMVLGGIFLLLSKSIKNMIVYQLLCSTLILLTGGLGFYQLLTGFYQSAINDIIKFIPNNWFIQGFTDIIVYGSTGNYLKQGHHVLLLMAGVVFILILVLDLIRWLIINKLGIYNRNRLEKRK